MRRATELARLKKFTPVRKNNVVAGNLTLQNQGSRRAHRDIGNLRVKQSGGGALLSSGSNNKKGQLPE